MAVTEEYIKPGYTSKRTRHTIHIVDPHIVYEYMDRVLNQTNGYDIWTDLVKTHNHHFSQLFYQDFLRAVKGNDKIEVVHVVCEKSEFNGHYYYIVGYTK